MPTDVTDVDALHDLETETTVLLNEAVTARYGPVVSQDMQVDYVESQWQQEVYQAMSTLPVEKAGDLSAPLIASACFNSLVTAVGNLPLHRATPLKVTVVYAGITDELHVSMSMMYLRERSYFERLDYPCAVRCIEAITDKVNAALVTQFGYPDKDVPEGFDPAPVTMFVPVPLFADRPDTDEDDDADVEAEYVPPVFRPAHTDGEVVSAIVSRVQSAITGYGAKLASGCTAIVRNEMAAGEAYPYRALLQVSVWLPPEKLAEALGTDDEDA